MKEVTFAVSVKLPEDVDTEELRENIEGLLENAMSTPGVVHEDAVVTQFATQYVLPDDDEIDALAKKLESLDDERVAEMLFDAASLDGSNAANSHPRDQVRFLIQQLEIHEAKRMIDEAHGAWSQGNG